MQAGRLLVAIALALAGTAVEAAPVRLARTPDFHAGKIAFSYFGDLWVVNEDGSAPHRLTDNVARDINPRFSPDGKWITFSSQRFGNYDVFAIPASGGTARRLTFHSGEDMVVGWTPDSKQIVFRASRGDGAFPSVSTLYQVPIEGGRETSLPTDWGWWGSYSRDGKRFAFNRHPSSWTRKHYRGSYAADIWVADIAGKTAKPVLAEAAYNRYWPMFAGNDEIYFVGDPLPNEEGIKPGSPEVRRSLNNIYKVSLKAGSRPVQVTRHASGNVFYPSLSSDGKVIVYEADFGLWKLDVASGKSTEVKIDITTEEKTNQTESVVIENEADGFDVSPSGKRAVISARNQLFTIATDKGDISTIANDRGASRNESPTWSPDGKHIAFISDRSGREEVYLVSSDGKNLRRISDLDTDKGSIVWAPDSKSLAFASTDKKLYLFTLRDGKSRVLTSSTLAEPRHPVFSPDSKWVSFTKQDETLRSHVYVMAISGGPERRIAEDDESFSEIGAVWSADGRFLAYTVQAGTGGGIASTGGRATSQMKLMALPLQAVKKDPLDKDVDSEPESPATAAPSRETRGTRGIRGVAAALLSTPSEVKEVKIDWSGLTKRARQIPVSGDFIGGLVAAPTDSVIAFVAGGRSGGDGATTGSGIYTVNLADGSEPAHVPSAPTGSLAGVAQGRGSRVRSGGGGLVFSKDGRSLYFRAGRGIYVAPVSGGRSASAPSASAMLGSRRWPSPGGTESAAAPSGAAARQLTFTIRMELDRRALRKEVFVEGWRVMKNYFYDAKMHGADWNAAKQTYGPLLDSLVDEEDLHTVLMMMIGELNASHTGVSGGPSGIQQTVATTRHPGFELVADPSGFYRVGHIWKDGPADKEYVKVRKGDFVLAVDGTELKTSDNQWRCFTQTSGRKFHFLLNDKPTTKGAWEIRLEPMSDLALSAAKYDKWVSDRRDIVNKLSGGQIGYLHIKAMDAPSLRQFSLDLAVNRTKKALVIDERFNGGGGIDQELLGILVGQRYQYTRGRNAGQDVPRPLETFYGPMIVMQNERSASDAEMFPQGFKDLKLGRVLGVPTMGAVIGTGSFTLADGSSIRTPGSGVWTDKGENLENFGVKPDVTVDNTPEDFCRGRDAQLEKAVELLKADIAAGKKKGV
jgi:tricorn protease